MYQNMTITFATMYQNITLYLKIAALFLIAAYLAM